MHLVAVLSVVNKKVGNWPTLRQMRYLSPFSRISATRNSSCPYCIIITRRI